MNSGLVAKYRMKIFTLKEFTPRVRAFFLINPVGMKWHGVKYLTTFGKK